MVASCKKYLSLGILILRKIPFQTPLRIPPGIFLLQAIEMAIEIDEIVDLPIINGDFLIYLL